MDRLRRRDLITLLEFLEESYALTNLDDFAAHLVRKLPGLVGSDLTGYNEVNLRKHRTAFFLEPRIHLRDSVEIFNRHAHEHPLIRYHAGTMDGGPTTISDFLTQRQLHPLGLYNEFFRPLGVEYQMAVTLHRAPDLIVALALNRARRDFSERDRVVLAALRPHLARAYRNAERLTELRRELDLVIQGVEASGIAVVRLTRDGRLEKPTPTVVERLTACFGPRALGRLGLPEPLRCWIHRQASHCNPENGRLRAPMIVEKDSRRFVLTLVGSTARPFLLIEERRPAVDRDSLRALGLTDREADVLGWVAQGKTDAETGTILGISRRTVAKHLEHIFQKLGVETRTAAAVCAVEAARQ